MHGLHDLTGNEDKKLKGESIIVNLFSERLIQWNSLLCAVIFCCTALPLCFPVFCFSFFGMGSIITKTNVHSMTHTIPLILSPTPNSWTSNPLTLSSVFDYYTLIYLRQLSGRFFGAMKFLVTFAIYADLRAAFRKYRPTVGTSSKFDFAHFWLIDNPSWVMKHAVVRFPK